MPQLHQQGQVEPDDDIRPVADVAAGLSLAGAVDDPCLLPLEGRPNAGGDLLGRRLSPPRLVLDGIHLDKHASRPPRELPPERRLAGATAADDGDPSRCGHEGYATPLPGFMIPCGSRACLIRRMRVISMGLL